MKQKFTARLIGSVCVLAVVFASLTFSAFESAELPSDSLGYYVASCDATCPCEPRPRGPEDRETWI